MQLLHEGDEFAVEVDHHRLLLGEPDVGQDSNSQVDGLKVPEKSLIINIVTNLVT